MNTFSRFRVSQPAKQTSMKQYPSLFLAALCGALLCLAPGRLTWAADAKPPTQLTYQGFLTDANGVPLGNTAPLNKTIIFRIYDAATAGNLKWSAQQVVTLDKGHFSVLLGEGSQVGQETFNADLTSVFSGSSDVSDRYLQLTVDGVNVAPRLRFLPAPYAVHARTATQLVDPLTGASSLAINGGNLTAVGTITSGSITASGNISASGNLSAANLSGNGANLTSLNASQITSGTLDNARTTATPNNTPGAIVARDGGGAVLLGNVFSRGFLNAMGSSTVHDQGAFLEWNRPTAIGGQTWLLNQKGGGGGGIIFGEVSTANDVTERMRIDGSGNVGIGTAAPSAKLEVSGGVVANSFKITGTPTLVAYSMSRFSAKTANSTPVAGVSQTTTSGGVGRQDNVPADWYRAAQTSKNTTFYLCTVTVPAGEKWELAYNVTVDWSTDDFGAVVWTVNDELTDDSSSALTGRPQGSTFVGQTFLLDGGSTYTLRMKGTLTGGSGSDSINFPGGGSCHCIIKKYKSN